MFGVFRIDGIRWGGGHFEKRRRDENFHIITYRIIVFVVGPAQMVLHNTAKKKSIRLVIVRVLIFAAK